jgi:hypothetical protein
MNDDRPNVCKAPVNIFGNESSLFVSLFKACDGRQIEEPELDNYFLLNDISPNKMRGFEWITEGMPCFTRTAQKVEELLPVLAKKATHPSPWQLPGLL